MATPLIPVISSTTSGFGLERNFKRSSLKSRYAFLFFGNVLILNLFLSYKAYEFFDIRIAIRLFDKIKCSNSY